MQYDECPKDEIIFAFKQHVCVWFWLGDSYSLTRVYSLTKAQCCVLHKYKLNTFCSFNDVLYENDGVWFYVSTVRSRPCLSLSDTHIHTHTLQHCNLDIAACSFCCVNTKRELSIKFASIASSSMLEQFESIRASKANRTRRARIMIEWAFEAI